MRRRRCNEYLVVNSIPEQTSRSQSGNLMYFVYSSGSPIRAQKSRKQSAGTNCRTTSRPFLIWITCAPFSPQNVHFLILNFDMVLPPVFWVHLINPEPTYKTAQGSKSIFAFLLDAVSVPGVICFYLVARQHQTQAQL
nr:MAG TPA: hypothetical protein [Caudoviricetes sp.]